MLDIRTLVPSNFWPTSPEISTSLRSMLDCKSNILSRRRSLGTCICIKDIVARISLIDITWCIVYDELYIMKDFCMKLVSDIKDISTSNNIQYSIKLKKFNR